MDDEVSELRRRLTDMNRRHTWILERLARLMMTLDRRSCAALASMMSEYLDEFES